jgi:hypothetical protein
MDGTTAQDYPASPLVRSIMPSVALLLNFSEWHPPKMAE